jgi:DNA-binding beta-propeller fold protein YncE
MTMRISMRSRIAIPVFAVVTLLLSLVFTPAGSAEEPGPLYATAGGGTKLVAFNLKAGRVRNIGDIGFPDSLSLAFCRPGGRPYTITNTFDPANAQLAALNLDTGAATPVGSPLGQDLSIMGMTCSPSGTLYAVGQFNSLDPDFNSLYTVDRETGLASRVGSTGISGADVFSGFVMALDFAPDGTLYAANTSALYIIDPLTGHATKVVDFTGVTMVMGLAIAKDWNFYVSDWVAQSNIYALDVVTGAATPVLNSGLSFVHNLSFKAPAR